MATEPLHVPALGVFHVSVATDADADELAQLHADLKAVLPSWSAPPAPLVRIMIRGTTIERAVFTLVAREAGGVIRASVECVNAGIPSPVLDACGGGFDKMRILRSMAVAPQCQSRGLGGFLLEAAVVVAKESWPELQSLVLDTSSELAARFYSRHGFIEVARDCARVYLRRGCE